MSCMCSMSPLVSNTTARTILSSSALATSDHHHATRDPRMRGSKHAHQSNDEAPARSGRAPDVFVYSYLPRVPRMLTKKLDKMVWKPSAVSVEPGMTSFIVL